MKIKSIISVITLIFLVMVLNAGKVSASEPIVNDITPCMPLEFSDIYYDETYTKFGETETFRHTHENNYNVTDSVTYSVSIRVYALASVTTQVKFDSIVTEVGVSATVSLGVDKQTTTSMTWQIPPYTTRTLVAGYRYIDTYGELYKKNAYCQKVVIENADGEWYRETFSR